jgi:hypothetical protein
MKNIERVMILKSPLPSFAKRGIPPFGKGREGGISPRMKSPT